MSRNTSPTVARQIEREITAEAKKEDKAFRHVTKDFQRLEKADTKAHKLTDKAEKYLSKAQKKEQQRLRELHKAQERYNQAKMRTVHQVDELGGARQDEQRIRQELQRKKGELDEATEIHETNEQARLGRLNTIRSTNRGDTNAMTKPRDPVAEGGGVPVGNPPTI